MNTFANHPYASFLHEVEKPARYAGGEAGQAKKDWSAVQARVCLAFPDVYDIGMSHLGYKILYRVLNDDPRLLAERCYTPWVDMEAELRKRDLPLVSLETAHSLCEFDVVGLSLQYELTYTNCLTILDLGRVPLRSADRGENDPLVIAGGPTATHPEPMAAFMDAIVIGDGEERLPQVALLWTELKAQGVPRRERLERLAALGGVYVPSLYTVSRHPDTGFLVVDKPVAREDAPSAFVPPFPVPRAFVPDLSKYPFPDDGPVGGPEAIFDRMSIEIARGCTEGCRFCQAGMIYRPVRERDPQEIVDTVVAAVKKSGFDEVSLTSLSTADYSCVSPLIKKVVEKLKVENVSLGVSSLRAYGLEEDLLDELGTVRATGLTFAPEAGSQRMRDVINKNVTEEQLLETADRVFSRNWTKMKLYFMIGLPTEEDADVRGIVATGARALGVGRKHKGGRAKVTVSVSSHVPKPHTPFQWCAMDAPEEITRKQRLLKDDARLAKVDLKTHRCDESVLEGVFARGDRSLSDVIEDAWRNGARFDSWEEHMKLGVWYASFEKYGIDTSIFLGTIPVTAPLPWDHIDVGLEPGFLAKEYRKALKNRLSPPCGKTIGSFVHYTNVEAAEADKRPLVCYDCGVACDLTQMRNERIDFLTKMGALRRLPVIADEGPALPRPEKKSGGKRPPRVRPVGENPVRYRFRFEKTGPAALLGHLDLVREIPRVMRRLSTPLSYSLGYHPRPDLVFSPALSVGVLSLGEFVDVKMLADLDPADMVDEMNAFSAVGLSFTGGVSLGPEDAGITKILSGARYLLTFARSAIAESGGERWLEERVAALLAASEHKVRREIDGLAKYVDVRSYVTGARVLGAEARGEIARAGL
ncbi:MAG: TIGR03960 family B12-binding radical SAM protein, partial [Polyangiaceae bacterium]